MELMTQRHRLPAILEAREALETQLAALAAARRTETDLAAMDRALNIMAADIDADGFGEEGDRQFHEAVTRRHKVLFSPTSWQPSRCRSARPGAAHSASRDALPGRCGPITGSSRQSGAATCPVHARPCAVT